MLGNCKVAILGGLLLAFSQPATCTLFSGSNIGLGIGLSPFGNLHGWDTSGLSVSDTADGITITGVMSANITETGPLGEISSITLSSSRQMADGANLNLTSRAAHTGTLSYTGDINVQHIITIASLNLGACAAYAVNDTGGNRDISLGQGAFAAGPTETNCQATLADGNGIFILSTTIGYIVNGIGTISINFGNSIHGDTTLTVDEVPEPSTLWLLSTIIPVALYRQRHQPISRIRS